ncbi:MAG: DNA polymerase IV [Bacteroidota bacterium]
MPSSHDKPVRKILHIDMDAFYASVEQRDHPEWRGKPVIVGGRPDSRGVVAAASYEARRWGIHSAMPASRARQLCPTAIFVRPRFEIYRQVSGEIRKIFSRYTDRIEPLSLDEAYLDVTLTEEGQQSAIRVAQRIRQEIRQETGLTASAGISVNKFLAKMASDVNKPNGYHVILPHEIEPFLDRLEIEAFHGIGKATGEKMRALGIFTGADLKKIDELELVRHFGKAGHHYFRIARGVDDRPVTPRRIRKSVGKEHTFPEDHTDLETLVQWIDQLSIDVFRSLERLETSGRTVTLKVRYDDFETVTRSHTLGTPLRNGRELQQTGRHLLTSTEAGERAVRLVGITVSGLTHDREGEQLEIPFHKQQPFSLS